jgi:SAM-dependent methyltransferase
MSADPLAPPKLGQLGLSEALRQFVGEMPYERRPILDFLMEVSTDIEPGTAVLDVGAGDAPYRELFAHTTYMTNDWEESVHAGGRRADFLAPAWALPVEDSRMGAVICTQVLEHIADPADVVAECLRVLEPGGRLALTVPLVWQLHELPHDYYRFTPAGLSHLLARAGFIDIVIKARNDCFSTLAQMMLNLGSTMGRTDDGLDDRRDQAQAILAELAEQIVSFAPLDVDRTFPLGYSALAQRP